MDATSPCPLAERVRKPGVGEVGCWGGNLIVLLVFSPYPHPLLPARSLKTCKALFPMAVVMPASIRGNYSPGASFFFTCAFVVTL